MDPGTAAVTLGALAAATKVTAPVIERVLGPTADYLGDELAAWAQKRRENFGRLLEEADRKLPASSAGGGVPPRVLARIISDGTFADDPVAVEYLGGILASSKTGVSRDDRGAAMAAMVSRLSAYDLGCTTSFIPRRAV